MRVVVVTPPQPMLSPEELKAHLRVDSDGENSLIGIYVAAAIAHIDGPDGWLGRCIGRQELELQTDRDTAGLRFPYPPFVELTGVSFLDASGVEQQVDPATLVTFNGCLISPDSWPWASASDRPDAVRIRYRAGYETLPPAIRVALLLMVDDLYRNRGETVAGVTVGRVNMPTSVEALLAPFRVYS